MFWEISCVLKGIDTSDLAGWLRRPHLCRDGVESPQGTIHPRATARHNEQKSLKLKLRACREGCHSRQDRRSFTDWARRAFDSSCARSFLSLGGLVHQEQCESLAFSCRGIRLTNKALLPWLGMRSISMRVNMAWPNLRGVGSSSYRERRPNVVLYLWSHLIVIIAAIIW